LQCTLFLPAEFGEAAFEGFAIVAAVALGIDGRTARLKPWQPVRHLAGANQVAPTHLGAVDPQIARRQLDQPLAKERALIAARRAIGAGRGPLVTLDHATVTAVILAVGGFLGIGDRLVAVPVNQIRDGPEARFITDLTKEQLANAPVFDFAKLR
jgi:hypothetical protein